MGLDVATMAVSSLVNLVIGGIVGGTVKRWIEKTDEEIRSARTELKTLRETRIQKLEDSLGEVKVAVDELAAKENGDDRYVRTHFVPIQRCLDQHKAQEVQLSRLQALAEDMARSQERMAALSATLDHVQQRQIALGEDLARMEGRDQGRGARALERGE